MLFIYDWCRQFPNSRFLSLKEIINNSFIVTGPINSRKGLEISKNNKVSLAFWWTMTERQIRIQGEATKIPNHLADKFFSERSIDAQVVSLISEQGNEIDNLEILNQKYIETEQKFSDKSISRPENWGGFSIKPIRIEFMEFKTTRFHKRKLFELINEKWLSKQLQP